jgi:EAL domain-containing protein (putative c-di-GMP-specific phosphodiesterase class I)
MGWWVLKEACRQLKIWQDAMPQAKSLFVSVNVSGKQFSQRNLPEMLKDVLGDIGVDPKNLKIEITESALIENSNNIIDILTEIRAMGIKLCIDDFGTGYSSLSYLHQFPCDALKIDRSFLENADSDFEKLEILQSVVRLAWNLGLEVVAEGIETQQHLARIRALSCESGQGFLFSRPLAVNDAKKLIRQQYS